jgi:hypothetical protein
VLDWTGSALSEDGFAVIDEKAAGDDYGGPASIQAPGRSPKPRKPRIRAQRIWLWEGRDQGGGRDHR